MFPDISAPTVQKDRSTAKKYAVHDLVKSQFGVAGKKNETHELLGLQYYLLFKIHGSY